MQFLVEPDGCAISKFLNIFRIQICGLLHFPCCSEFIELRCSALQNITSPDGEPVFFFGLFFRFFVMILSVCDLYLEPSGGHRSILSLAVLQLHLYLQQALNLDLQKYKNLFVSNTLEW